jgi:hypothetical protein
VLFVGVSIELASRNASLHFWGFFFGEDDASLHYFSPHQHYIKSWKVKDSWANIPSVAAKEEGPPPGHQ